MVAETQQKVSESFNFLVHRVILAFLIVGLALGHDVQPESVLEHLRAMDSVYRAGFTVSGTYVHANPDKSYMPPTRKVWKLTMSDSRIAYDEEVVEVLRWQEVLDPDTKTPEVNPAEDGDYMMTLRAIVVVSPTTQAKYTFFGQIPPIGKIPPRLEESPGLATSGYIAYVEPDAPTYMFQIQQTLWSIGRDYSDYIT